MTTELRAEKSYSEILDSLQDDALDTSSVEHMTMIELITSVNRTLTEGGLSQENVERIRPWLIVLARRQGLSAKKMFVISVIMNFYAQGGACVEDITQLCKCDNMDFLLLYSEMTQLVAEGYIMKQKQQYHNTGASYTVSSGLFSAYMNNRTCPQRNYTCASDLQFLSKYFETDNEYHMGDIDYAVFDYRIRFLMDKNPDLHIIKTLFSVSELEEMSYKYIMLNLCSRLVLRSETEIFLNNFNLLYLANDGFTQNIIAGELAQGEGALFDAKLVEFVPNDGMYDCSKIKLTKKAIRLFLGDFKLCAKNSQKSDTTSIVSHKTIAEKRLFFDERVEQQVSRLSDLLSDVNFRSIQSRLKAKGLRKGFTCFFYGSPGTGKTETALQLARATGRDIMQVNISEIRSMWVGESEKNIQALFDDYRQQIKTHKRCPILLFNEADAIFNQRSKNSKRSVDKMENSIQNIILQEMEKLDGILIATTNLQGNLDKAFERRFLYKVEFTRPNLEARTNIWHSLMPELDETTARKLAHDYDLSGGQIENVARKSMVDEILYGTPSDHFARLSQYCDDERLEKRVRKRIGFTAAS